MTRTILAIILSLIVLSAPAHATAASDIKLIKSSTDNQFPDLLTFNVRAESPARIDRIRLRYEVDKMTYAPSFAEAWPDIQPGKDVSASWSWDMRKGSLPPGAKITYWWVIENTAGNSLTTPKETVSFDDNRYKWQKVGYSNISIFWYQGNRSFADELLKASQDAAAQLGKDTGGFIEKPVSFYIYGNYQDLRGSIVAPEEWTGGVAYAGFNIISIGISPGNLDWGKKAVAHELGHLITHQVTVSPYGATIPPWLDEGLAMHAEGEQSDSDKGALLKAIDDGRLATLQSLSSPFPADPQEAFYAYAQSQSVVEYIINVYGKDKLNHLLVLLNDGNTMDDALLKTYGVDRNGLDEAWINFMIGQPGKKTDTGAILRKDSPRPVSMLDYLTPRALTPQILAGAG
ncbi:MAG: peptidase MA family metallohydrolase [Chloroflexi bacterium]|nr:peptidase MA family metallohydrolase [Chloroflexota bacterium]